MKKLLVGLQLYTIRDMIKTDPAGIIKQVKEMGYDGVELAGFHGVRRAALKKMLDANGLTVISAHVAFAQLRKNPEAVVEKYAKMGCRYLSIPWLAHDALPGGENFLETEALLHQIGGICKAHGMTLLYHNHEFEFSTLPNGGRILDALYERIPADILQTQIDVCWTKVAGLDPAAYIRKYAGRCPVVHYKDFFKEGAAVDMYALMGGKGEGKDGKKDGVFEFRPVGLGMQDFPPIIEATVESGAQWVIVEQDASVGRPSLEAARLSREYLKSLGQ